MPPGPLPNPARRRRNAPAIPTTTLVVTGRKGTAPRCPYPLRKAGTTWWRWAWKQPQALAWSTGDLYVAARRAQLEDDLDALHDVRPLELDALIGDPEVEQSIRQIIGALRSLAGNGLAVAREMREIDDRLGLTPKGLAALRWKIVAPLDEDDEDTAPGTPSGPAPGDDRRRRLTVAS